MSEITRISIGEIEIRRIPEMEIPFRTPDELFRDSTPEVMDAHKHWMPPTALCPESGKLSSWSSPT